MQSTMDLSGILYDLNDFFLQYMSNTPLVSGDATVQESVRSAIPSLAEQVSSCWHGSTVYFSDH